MVPLEVFSTVNVNFSFVSGRFEVVDVHLLHDCFIFDLLGSSARGEGLPLSQVVTPYSFTSSSEFCKADNIIFVILHVVPAEDSSKVVLISKLVDADILEELVASGVVHVRSIFLVAFEESLNFRITDCSGSSWGSHPHHLVLILSIEYLIHRIVLVPTWLRY